MREVRDERRVSMVLMRRMVLDVRVAICMYAVRRAGEREPVEVVWWGREGFWGLGVL